jgi:hypothetical protein
LRPGPSPVFARATRRRRLRGYPIVPSLYIVAATALTADLLIVKPTYTWPSLLIALSGTPIYYLQRPRPSSEDKSPLNQFRSRPYRF